MSLYIHNRDELIYWADNTGRIEQIGYNGTGRLLIRQLSSTSSINGLAADSNFVFISDSNQRQIQRINRSNNELSNLTGVRFTRPYAITLFRSATWFVIKSPISITPSPTSGSTDIVTRTTIIVATVVIGAVVLIVVIVTVGIVLSKKCRRKPSAQLEEAYNTSIPSVYDTINYASLQNGSTSLSPEVEHQNGSSEVQDNQPESRNDRASGPYELNDFSLERMSYLQLYSQLMPEGCQQSTICAPDENPSDPSTAYEPKEDDGL